MLFSNSRTNLHRSHSLATLAIGMILAIVSVLMLLAAFTSNVNAARSADPIQCGDNPACGYIQMHAYDSVVPRVMPACGDNPACGYIQMHSAPGEATLVEILTVQAPLESEPQLAVSRSTLVRSSPEADAYSYGELPARFVSVIIGVNPEETWWVIPLPMTISPDGLGWVDTASTTASNVSFPAADPAACGSLPICGYIAMHNQADLRVGPLEQVNCSESPSCEYIKAYLGRGISVLEPTYAVEKLMGQPLIAMTGR